MRTFLFTLFFLICYQMAASAQEADTITTNQSTQREASISWYFGGQQVMYRKKNRTNLYPERWKRYQLKALIDFSIDNQDTNFSSSGTVGNRSNVSLSVGREKRIQAKEVEFLQFYYGLDFSLGYGFLEVLRSETSNNSTRYLREHKQSIDFGPVGFAGLRASLHKHFSVSIETAIYGFVDASYSVNRYYSPSNLNSTIEKNRYWKAGINAGTIPIRALWLTYQF